MTLYYFVFTPQVIPNYSSREMYDKLFALGVTIYGQMTAGSYCYIGPQGIVHGTTVSVHTVATIVNRIMVVELQHMEAIIIIIL